MERKINITAVCGWALSEEWFCQLVKNHFPEAEIQAHYPRDPENENEAAEVLGLHSDWVIGYSLGSLWLLTHKNKIPKQTKIVLLAPILAFSSEKNLGGKTPIGKLKYQKKILGSSKDYWTTLKNFFDLSGIEFHENALHQSMSRETLIRGLEFLESTSVSPDAAQGCMAFAGLRDPLLDAHRLKELIPQLILLEQCSHSPHKMLSRLAQLSHQLHEFSPQPISRQRVL